MSKEKDKSFWNKFKSKENNEKKEIVNLNKFVSCLFDDEKLENKLSNKTIKDISGITDLSENYITFNIIKTFTYI